MILLIENWVYIFSVFLFLVKWGLYDWSVFMMGVRYIIVLFDLVLEFINL